ncbi:mechanosensitive ion channel family protein, partial [Vibrio cincinnatiensis]|nr:mechanosensitive ion channel family protein [Vibrio cincinnatiensis]
LFLAKQIITPYHAAQKLITKDQHALDKHSISLSNIAISFYLFEC